MTDSVTATGTDELTGLRSGANIRVKISYIWTYFLTLTGNMAATARTAVRKNSTGSVYERRRLNFIEGTNVTLTVADDSGNEEVDITIAASGGGGGSTGLVARYHLTSQLTTNNGVETVFNATVSDYDPGTAVTTGGSWHYTVPTVTGTVWYNIRMAYALFIANGNAWQDDKECAAFVYVNGSWVTGLSSGRTYASDGTNRYVDLSGAVSVPCVTGDTIHVTIYNNTGATRKMDTDSAIEIHRAT